MLQNCTEVAGEDIAGRSVGVIDNMRPLGIVARMKAEVLLDERHIIAEDAFVEIAIWRVPSPVRGSAHALKYRLALVVRGECVLRYDNEAGKGDHRHSGGAELPYKFRSHEQLLSDFWAEVDMWRRRT